MPSSARPAMQMVFYEHITANLSKQSTTSLLEYFASINASLHSQTVLKYIINILKHNLQSAFNANQLNVQSSYVPTAGDAEPILKRFKSGAGMQPNIRPNRGGSHGFAG